MNLTTDAAIAAVVLAVALVYGMACWLFPFRACKRCAGRGKVLTDRDMFGKPCRRCQATGRRLRIGRRVWNFYYLRHRAADRYAR